MNAVETTGDVTIVLDSIEALDVDAICALPIETQLVCVAILEEANRTLGVVRALLTPRVAKAMPDKQMTVSGAGTFEVHRKKSRTQWDKDDLLRAVLDSRIVNPNTGEVKEETPIEKVLHVWNLGAPRTTALRERGLSADEFCHTELGDLSIEITR